MAITYRSSKGSALTHAELDENFSFIFDKIDGLEIGEQIFTSSGNFVIPSGAGKIAIAALGGGGAGAAIYETSGNMSAGGGGAGGAYAMFNVSTLGGVGASVYVTVGGSGGGDSSFGSYVFAEGGDNGSKNYGGYGGDGSTAAGYIERVIGTGGRGMMNRNVGGNATTFGSGGGGFTGDYTRNGGNGAGTYLGLSGGGGQPSPSQTGGGGHGRNTYYGGSAGTGIAGKVIIKWYI